MTEQLNSALYYGQVFHKRYRPKPHQFAYPVYLIYLNLDEIDAVLSLSRCCSASRWAPLRFLRKDFHGDASISIKQSVYDTVEGKTGVKLDGPVYMLGNWRCFGFNFNPLVTYYCFDASGEHLRYVLAEVTNTPWLERHAYVFSASDQKKDGDANDVSVDHVIEKAFTVSPFNPLNMTYAWRSTTPGERLNVSIENAQHGEKVFFASMKLKKQALNSDALVAAVTRFPFMALSMVFSIYLQALKLFLKGIPFLGKDKVKRV